MPAQSKHQALAQRAFSVMASPRAHMAALDGGFAIYRGADRRRRPALLVPRVLGEEWIAQDLVRQVGPHSYRLGATPARPPTGETPAGERPVTPTSRGLAGLESHESAALERLSADLEAAHAGALRGVDWSAPSRSRNSGPIRDPLAAGAAARGRARQALAALAQPLADVVQTLCTERISLELLERRFQWPARSAKLAIKLAAAQLAHHYRYHAPAGRA